MDLCLPADFFHPANGRTAPRDDLDPSLGADAHVHLDAAFVTGLRDWRSGPRSDAFVTTADREWHAI